MWKRMDQLYEREVEKPSHRAILICFIKHEDRETGEAWPSAGKIAWATDYSERHIRRGIRKLTKAGVLEWTGEWKSVGPHARLKVRRVHLDQLPPKPGFIPKFERDESEPEPTANDNNEEELEAEAVRDDDQAEDQEDWLEEEARRLSVDSVAEKVRLTWSADCCNGLLRKEGEQCKCGDTLRTANPDNVGTIWQHEIPQSKSDSVEAWKRTFSDNGKSLDKQIGYEKAMEILETKDRLKEEAVAGVKIGNVDRLYEEANGGSND